MAGVMSLLKRGVLLYLTGVVLSLIIYEWQIRRHATLSPLSSPPHSSPPLSSPPHSSLHHLLPSIPEPNLLYLLLTSPLWWMPLISGVAAVCVGLLYPCLDAPLLSSTISSPHHSSSEWSRVLRCLAVFLGINHASAKIAFTTSFQCWLIVSLMCVCLWVVFDRSLSGLIISSSVAATSAICWSLHMKTRSKEVIDLPNEIGLDMSSLAQARADLPSIIFAACVAIGNMGRLLAWRDEKMEVLSRAAKQHVD